MFGGAFFFQLMFKQVRDYIIVRLHELETE